jgi:hypothetical protein
MALTLEEALTELGILKGKLEPLQNEVNSLRSHKERLDGDVAKLRDRAQDAERERDDLKGKVPADGSLTLNKADAERWRVLSGVAGELGGVDKVQERLSRAKELEAKEAKRERKEGLKSQGFNPTVFDAIAEGNPYRVEEKDGAKTVFLTIGDEEIELNAYAEKTERADLLSYLALETPEPKQPGVPAAAQAGKRSNTSRLSTPEEIAEAEKHNPRYSI